VFKINYGEINILGNLNFNEDKYTRIVIAETVSKLLVQHYDVRGVNR